MVIRLTERNLMFVEVYLFFWHPYFLLIFRLEDRRKQTTIDARKELWWTRREPCRNRETTAEGHLWWRYPSSTSNRCHLNRCQGHPNSRSHPRKIEARLTKTRTTLSTRSENSLCGYRRTFKFSPPPVIFVNDIYHRQRTWLTPSTNLDFSSAGSDLKRRD
jgi:hypothetical protein